MKESVLSLKVKTTEMKESVLSLKVKTTEH